MSWAVPQPKIKGYCRRCRGARHAFQVVSPSGLAHIGEDFGTTACGIDATGDRWWWPL